MSSWNSEFCVSQEWHTKLSFLLSKFHSFTDSFIYMHVACFKDSVLEYVLYCWNDSYKNTEHTPRIPVQSMKFRSDLQTT